MKTCWMVVAVLAAACGGDDIQIEPDAGPVPDAAPIVDAGPLAGTTPISATFYVNHFNSPSDHTVLAGAYVRLENAAGDFIETTTAADGSVTFMVDLAKGPFDVSFAKRSFISVSIMDVTSSLGEVGTYAFSQEETTSTVTGAITNKLDATDRVFVERHSMSQGIHSGASYVTSGYGPNHVAAPVIGLEVDAAGNAVNITQSTPTTLTSAADLPLAFPTPPPAITTIHATLDLPTTGVVTADTFSTVTGVALVGPVRVMREQVPAGGATVGTGTVGALVGHTRALELKTFAGDFAPDVAYTILETPTGASPAYTLYASLFPVVEGGTATVLPVDALTTTGDTLGDLRMTSGGAGYEYAELDVVGNTGWIVWSPTATLTNRALPHLPSQALESVVDSKPMLRVALSVVANSAQDKPPWQEFRGERQLSIEVVRKVTNSGR